MLGAVAIHRRTNVRPIRGIDYSGAAAPTSSLKGLRVYVATGKSAPYEVQPPPSPRRYWTRRGIAEWLVGELAVDSPTLEAIPQTINVW